MDEHVGNWYNAGVLPQILSPLHAMLCYVHAMDEQVSNWYNTGVPPQILSPLAAVDFI